MELIVVLMILAGTAALVLMPLGSATIDTIAGPKTENRIASETTMQKIRDAIMGGANRQGYWADLGQRPELFPRKLADLFYRPSYLPNAYVAFDPVTKVGWRGSYFVQSTGRFDFTGLDPLDGSFALYGSQGELAITDAWGHPVVIQIPDVNDDGENVSANELAFVRLVSAGEPDADGVCRINTPPNVEVPTPIQRGNDIVLFLRMTDPFANP